jgi:transposase
VQAPLGGRRGGALGSPRLEFTRALEDQASWLAVNTSKTAVSRLMRIAWRTVGWICERVMVEQTAKRDLFAG